MSRRVLLWIAACKSRCIHRRIRDRWLSEHATDNYNIDDYFNNFLDNDHYDYRHRNNNQHDYKHDHNDNNAMRWQMLH
jgi:hypothetical protein